jgi:hypothetical protein
VGSERDDTKEQEFVQKAKDRPTNLGGVSDIRWRTGSADDEHGHGGAFAAAADSTPAELEAAANATPKDRNKLLLNAGNGYERQGCFDDAVRVYRQIFSLNPTFLSPEQLSAMIACANIYVQVHNDVSSALELLRKYRHVKAISDVYNGIFENAVAWEKTGDAKTGDAKVVEGQKLECYRHALERYIVQEQFDKALAVYNKAMNATSDPVQQSIITLNLATLFLPIAQVHAKGIELAVGLAAGSNEQYARLARKELLNLPFNEWLPLLAQICESLPSGSDVMDRLLDFASTPGKICSMLVPLKMLVDEGVTCAISSYNALFESLPPPSRNPLPLELCRGLVSLRSLIDAGYGDASKVGEPNTTVEKLYSQWLAALQTLVTPQPGDPVDKVARTIAECRAFFEETTEGNNILSTVNFLGDGTIFSPRSPAQTAASPRGPAHAAALPRSPAAVPPPAHAAVDDDLGDPQDLGDLGNLQDPDDLGDQQGPNGLGDQQDPSESYLASLGRTMRGVASGVAGAARWTASWLPGWNRPQPQRPQ